ncbi:MAG: hypothetical protein UIH27_08270 [Ruminococcus sp.]|nr:hypothetical protein [Ruminococcus sp.]
MKVEYKFADGTVSEVEVPEEIGAYIMESRKAEESNGRVYRSHNYSLDSIEYEGEEYGYVEPFRLEEAEDRELLEKALSLLTEIQRRRMKMFIEGLSYRKIAEIEGVDHKCIMRSIELSQKKIKNFIEESPQSTNFPSV